MVCQCTLKFIPINVCNIDVGNIIPKHMTFKPNIMKHYPPQIIFLHRIFEPLMQTTRKQCVDVMQGGWIFSRYSLPDTATQAYFSLIKQIHIPHSIELCVTSTVAQFLPSTFLRHFCKQNHSLVPLICMSGRLKFMNCCKSFQSKHGQPWPRKGESWFLSTSDSFTKVPQNVMREEFVLQYF